ncbi:Oxaloacetate decarboxylase, gamma chain [Desulfosporosinus orientis DSM 765]|uniref:Oxaloacetate decarboxylase, gamma chain n=1 Tax=Desulfosporosinus orientis (strain ATCC 19365 / DSM 765 / NCIMB 8382 / VKM B-1628 / Singapore I) TaxID=768706 RepID=G7W714_DESOD|nr:OadG family protein [Desulfosporosinus orientis]AET69871.1 Oxaloacetate decarboxylase, gamma chain [Desulfosporosinus orientis DSM 765]
MSVADKLLLGANTAMIGMGIVFMVLVVLWAIIAAESKLISVFSERLKKPEIADKPAYLKEADLERKGITSGECVVTGGVDDETLALIMTVVSNSADISLNRLQLRSIKAL